MRKIRFLITFLFISTMGLTLFLFMNFTPYDYEVPYTSGTGIPLTDIVASTPGTPDYNHVIIDANEIAYIDQNIDVDKLTINGQLHCDQSLTPHNVVLKARIIYVNGIFQCGRSATTFNKNMTISLKPGAVNPATSVEYRGLVVNNGGRLILTGNRRKVKWMRLVATAQPGQNYIDLDGSVQTLTEFWNVGDKIVVGPSSYKSTEAETFTITAINNNRVTLSGALVYRHVGVKETFTTTYNGTIQLEQRAEVANLTRNIKIIPDESTATILETDTTNAELGGHVMVMGDAYVDSVEFHRLGQAGKMGRYPFHWHYAGDASGQFIKNSSIHHSFQRCITIHRTNKALVDNNVCYNFKGHGFFIEDGTEIDNVISNNLGILAKYPYVSKRLLASDVASQGDNTGRFPSVSVFWITNPKNTIINNVAAGSVGTGFWMSFVKEVVDNGIVVARPINEITTQFESNIAHSNQVGFTWDGAQTGPLVGNPNNPEDRKLEIAHYSPSVTPVFKKSLAYKNKLSGIYFRGQTSAFDQTVLADNGWNAWFAYNQILKNSVIIGRTANFSTQDQINALDLPTTPNRKMQLGIVQYDGPFELNRVDFVSYPTSKTYYNSEEVTPIPIGVTTGTERLTNMSKLISFLPDPIHKVYMPNETVNFEYSGNVSLRDQDGTLTGAANTILVGKTSMAILPNSNCTAGGDDFYTFVKCPASYTESELTFFGGEERDGDPNWDPWHWPAFAKRSDGKLSHPVTSWQTIILYDKGGNKFTLANSSSYDYEVMLRNRINPTVFVTSEVQNAVIPVTKINTQGTGCVLKNALTGVQLPSMSSLSALRTSSVSAFFTQGNDIYFRLLPIYSYWPITLNNGQGTATRYKSVETILDCVNDNPTPIVMGKVESVTRLTQNDPVIISGWACNFSKYNQITVNLAVRVQGSTTTPVTIKTGTANLLPLDAYIAFTCGLPGYLGYKYQFNLPRAEAEPHQGKEIHVYGVSNSGGATLPLQNSGTFTMPTYGALEN